MTHIFCPCCDAKIEIATILKRKPQYQKREFLPRDTNLRSRLLDFVARNPSVSLGVAVSRMRNYSSDDVHAELVGLASSGLIVLEETTHPKNRSIITKYSLTIPS